MTSPSLIHRTTTRLSEETETWRRAADNLRDRLNDRLSNPLAEFSDADLAEMGELWARKYLDKPYEDDILAFRLGAVCAKDPERSHEVAGLSDRDRDILRDEFAHRWQQPRLLYLLIVVCSVCATVQGMDETVVNGAQIFYAPQFGIHSDSGRDTWLLGFVNAAPYLCCAVLGCWLTVPFNALLGRRGTIFATCVISAVTVVWQAFTNSWWHLCIARFALGLGIGAKSATVPIWVAESTPPAIRGALVMQWQVWTAFGIMLGYVADLALYKVADPASGGITGLNWRLMLASAMLLAVVVCALVFACPESPRWYMARGRHQDAYGAMVRLPYCRVQAARDIFYMHMLLEAEVDMRRLGRSKLLELVTVPRNRRALIASEIVMFMQQFCGVNVIAYYSSTTFVEAGFSTEAALAISLGFGVINFLFALPAVHTIDTFGRRNLLLSTLPLMALILFFTGFSFLIPETKRAARCACITLGVYLFGVAYSPGQGPVPFTYSAEAYPLYVRSHGMSVATATTWFFNFLLAVTWPSMRTTFGDSGAFSWYAAWNLIGAVLVLLFVPETRRLTLEELNRVFAVPTRTHAAFGMKQLVYFFRRYVLCRRHDTRTGAKLLPPELFPANKPHPLSSVTAGVDANSPPTEVAGRQIPLEALQAAGRDGGREGGGGGGGGGGAPADDAVAEADTRPAAAAAVAAAAAGQPAVDRAGWIGVGDTSRHSIAGAIELSDERTES